MRRSVAAALLAVLFLVAGWWQPHDPAAIDLAARHAEASAAHPLGTDHLGRDVLSRLLADAARTALVVLIVAVVSSSVGTALGTTATFAPPALAAALMLLADLGLILPPIVLGLAAGALFGLSPVSAGIALGLGGFGPFAILAHGLTRRARVLPHVRAAEALGVGRLRAIVRHIGPDALDVLRTYLGSDAARHAISYASLAFLGLGVEVGQPDWGAMLFEYRPHMLEHPTLMLAPGLAIFLSALALHILIEPATAPGRRRHGQGARRPAS
ncbi:MAG: ABC transporter permease [Alphaproteobacteria bacterium]|nr:ABC transporter permease [Alphaproteobacteria bacterium]